MDVRIGVEGSDADSGSLWDWLRREPELRGLIRTGTAPPPDGAMGVGTEVVVALAGAGALWAALARSLSVWLTQRRSDVTLKVTVPGGRTVWLNAKRVADPEALLREVLAEVKADTPAAGPGTAPAE